MWGFRGVVLDNLLSPSMYGNTRLRSDVNRAVTTSSGPVSASLSDKDCTSHITGALRAEMDCTEIMMTSPFTVKLTGRFFPVLLSSRKIQVLIYVGAK